MGLGDLMLCNVPFILSIALTPHLWQDDLWVGVNWPINLVTGRAEPSAAQHMSSVSLVTLIGSRNNDHITTHL